MLLSQQARLVRLDDHRAVVQVANTWMAMVQTRQALVEQAISRALGGHRQLTLEAAGEAPPAAPGPPPQPVRVPAESAKAPPPPPPQPQPPLSAPHPEEPAPAPQATAPAPQTIPPTGDPPRQAPSQLDEKTRQLAEFFNGEVVDIEGPIDEHPGADAA
jgi:DNA polymerase-3 subunit gamma/tau